MVVGTKTRGSTFNQSGKGRIFGAGRYLIYLIVFFRVSISHFLQMIPLRDGVLLEKSVRGGDGSPL